MTKFIDKETEISSDFLILGASTAAMPEARKDDLMRTDPDRFPRSFEGIVCRCLERDTGIDSSISGKITPSEIRDYARNALTRTGPLNDIIGTTFNQSISLGALNAPTTYQNWVGRMTVRDYREFDRIKTSSFGRLQAGNDAQNISTEGIVESSKLDLKGGSVQLTLHEFYNSGLNSAIQRFLQSGKIVATTINYDVYRLLTSSSGAGPTLDEDDKALFHADHGNLVALGYGAVPSLTTVPAGCTAMISQPLPGAKDDYDIVNALPKYLICSGAQKYAAENAVAKNLPANSRNDISVIVDGHLDIYDSYGWYLAADPVQVDTISLVTLESMPSPVIKFEGSIPNTGGSISWRIYHSWGLLAGDYRGLYRNAGH
ncbi:MAG: hypothetical protein A2487_00030 [Candidatus Raymondbacteria bacterium RifOxyC12_full_50_8]|uniref:Bacteriophage Mu GpT domain-containing protein n=1 Tax=Candidatus Raymondbacteria bacterium RIFOXYD12_FULL_49_13 TaxID=1817890 RepID=A0A1F7F7C4_UNCRA|nr:MAG: hypothetical protein A2248_21975 [Candidatus Raymondbacteria bacterium RIFOXYA2_FULL_49_16]OGJ88425.1 MAG: hypothetical protein A2350_11305 [Candidatus Raymondbacteria bacterium RifOxyB12_full_50_8]OGJ96286.1 MAG: hypothetical protein A2453_08845 [Candidatus Raymondbacteria bacterium RIFOXYC2_FULL_50_21]OGK02493.1 MAG: hypothetical protein A2519_12190 [Candidatus Raymondbacteria bacterium RIFOXYD12_FULL_49_13]OGK03135.1 MAG: hypothetical protein A2487_00030 [Candidatus Raymondbacteria b